MINYGKTPCKDCQDRVSGCHAKCERYQDWVAQKEERKSQIIKQRETENALDEFLIGNNKKRRERINGGRK